ncbi:MAG: N-6 DNA methylase [Candidatus Sulfotelmatobacter sp.]
MALAPLFEAAEMENSAEHNVLLDGGYGTFALSTSDEELWRDPKAAAWVWSGDIPHHVTVTQDKVGVLRWDRPDLYRVFGRSGVERSLERFYQYIADDRLRSTNTVVDHLLGFFRRVRSLTHSAGLPDERATDLFLAALAQMIAPDEFRHDPERFGLTREAIELQQRLDQRAVAAATEEVIRGADPLSILRLHPALAVRHAGGRLFQEAHFELLRAPTSLDLFGLIEAPQIRQISRGGTHYTPPALARVLIEQALGNLAGVFSAARLTICDPACGSGAFLHEALRAFRRGGFEGHLTLIGQDISPAAIAMARFVLRASLRDWEPRAGVTLQLHAGDSLGELGIPPADVIVMNPPFVSFGAQTEMQRRQLREAVGKTAAARGDLSMAFVLRGVAALKPKGVLGALFPASLLSSKTAMPWRERLTELGDVRLVASIGEFGLFTHALVQVASAVICKSEASPDAELMALVTGNDPQATGEALRALRKLHAVPPATSYSNEEWSIFPVSSLSLKERPTWRFPLPRSERAVRALQDAQFPVIGDLFHVGQGIQTGLNEALLLTEEEWLRLPENEQRFFRPPTMSDSIQNGLIVSPYHLFFPHTKDGPLFADDKQLEAKVPTYYHAFLIPNKDRLARRATIRHTNRSDWWGLMRPRKWSFEAQPRIISKFFAGEGGFAGDYDASYVPVMGHIWLPKHRLTAARMNLITVQEMLAAYVAVFNSTPFVNLLELFSPHVAGGQFDLSSRHVSLMPMPDLRELSMDIDRGRLVSELVKSGRMINLADGNWRLRNNQLVTTLYGAQIIGEL